MMTVCLLALAAPISSSRRRLHAVRRHDDLGVSDSNSSAGEIIAGGWLTDYLSSEPGEELTGGDGDQPSTAPDTQPVEATSYNGPADDAAASIAVSEPAPTDREQATEATQVPAASSTIGNHST